MRKKFNFNDFLLSDKEDTPKSPRDTGVKFYVFSPKSRANIVTLNTIKNGQEYKEMHVNFITDKKLTHSIEINPSNNYNLFDKLDFNSIFKNWIAFDYLISIKPTLESAKFHKASVTQIKDNLIKLFEGKKASYTAEEVLGDEKFKNAVKTCKEYVELQNQKNISESQNN